MMAQQNTSAHLEESDDERLDASAEIKDDENDEFSTYFTDQKVEIPEIDKVFKTLLHSVNHPYVIITTSISYTICWQLLKVAVVSRYFSLEKICTFTINIYKATLINCIIYFNLNYLIVKLF